MELLDKRVLTNQNKNTHDILLVCINDENLDLSRLSILRTFETPC